VKQRPIPTLSAFRKPSRHRSWLGRDDFDRGRRARSTVRASLMTAVAIVTVAIVPGCNVFGKRDNASPSREFALQPSDSADVFKRVREAKTQNSIVVQVVGDSTPVRVLPLPPDDRSVFVSDLLKQTGLKDKIGPMRATVYRASSHSPMGIPMEVKFTRRGGDVRPDADYSLQAGDRIRITKDDRTAWGEMIDQFLPSRGG